MKLIAQTTATEPKPVTIPNGSILNNSTELALLVAAVTVVWKQVWEWYQGKEKAESELTNVLITDLRNDRKDLIEANKHGFDSMVKASSELKQAFVSTGETIHGDVQETLKSQAAIYRDVSKQLAELSVSIERVEKKVDSLTSQLSCKLVD